ncbi:MAG: DUF2299 domain-containing protein [Euryarchaeota archaeon]|nr:DUF2299 domain-containing protein [Euryarchaeota archaeon]
MVEEKQLADKVRGWLQGEGIFREEVETEKTDFHFIVNFPAGSNYVSEVIKPKEREYLIVGTSIQLADEHYKALHSLPKAEKEALLWQWRFDLLFRNAEFRMVPSARELRGVEFTRSIYLEDLSRTALMDALRELFKCKLYVIWRVAQLMGRSESEGAIYR